MKMFMEKQRLRTVKIIKKKNKGGGVTLSNFITYHKVALILTMGYSDKNRHTDQWSKTESPN
jgi:hypothetical protein